MYCHSPVGSNKCPGEVDAASTDQVPGASHGPGNLGTTGGGAKGGGGSGPQPTTGSPVTESLRSTFQRHLIGALAMLLVDCDCRQPCIELEPNFATLFELCKDLEGYSNAADVEMRRVGAAKVNMGYHTKLSSSFHTLMWMPHIQLYIPSYISPTLRNKGHRHGNFSQSNPGELLDVLTSAGLLCDCHI